MQEKETLQLRNLVLSGTDVIHICGDLDQSLVKDIRDVLQTMGFDGFVIVTPPGIDISTMSEEDMSNAGWVRKPGC
jgi:hypothetical protein